jgi:hypothetical protein
MTLPAGAINVLEQFIFCLLFGYSGLVIIPPEVAFRIKSVASQSVEFLVETTFKRD